MRLIRSVMKKLALFIFIVLIPVVQNSCNKAGGKRMKGDAMITFTETSHNYGEIRFDSDGDCIFSFINSGAAPLILTHVKSTCGCTIPEWSAEPVIPGDSARIVVSYDTHRVGRFNKSIYVYSNAINGTQRLFVSGEVKKLEEES